MKLNNNNIFRKCVEHYFQSNEKEEFFNPWFREYGKCYLFVFKKNLKVTNIQYAELVSLIRSNITIDNYADYSNIQFLAVKDFLEAQRKLFNSFEYKEKDEREKQALFDTIEQCYASIFNNIIVVDAFYGSCAVFLPYNINLDIENVCALSGYIHSCGDNIFTRRISKANKDDFFKKLQDYHKDKYLNITTKKIPFTLYCHEDFTPYDREEGKDFFINGLDGIKFYAEKLYMQSTPLTEIVGEMEEHDYFSKHLDVAKAGDYHRNIKGDNENTIWLITDKSANDFSLDPRIKKDIFLICYNQQFINENPYHLFDENKPGWIDHTTIPHTLMGAMLNISIPKARESKSKSGKISILDPFVGSGTTYLELLKFLDVDFSGSDLNNLTQIVTEDNLVFFGLNYMELVEIHIKLLYLEIIAYEDDEEENNYEKEIKYITTQISKITTSNRNNTKFNPLFPLQKKHELDEKKRKLKEEVQTDYNFVINFFIHLVNNPPQGGISEISQSVLVGKLNTFNERLFFYLCLKAYKRNQRAFKRGSKNWNSAFTKEISELRLQVNNLLKLRKRAKLESTNNNNIESTNDSSFIKYLSNYSYGCSINPDIFTNIIEDKDAKKRIKGQADVIIKLKTSIIDNEKYDIIITDPPYGFNTDVDMKSSASLYYKMIGLMIQCLNPNGQLLLCLPEFSNTGRQIHYFIQKEIVIRQILVAASENNKTLVLPVNILPSPTWLFKAPFYWESEKSLRRSILHFIFK